jgi:PPP family 3-phenylpropionic acid transporter
MPYFGPYLAEQGYSAVHIGELMALIGLTRVIAPNVLGWLADHSGQPLNLVRLCSVLGFFGFIGVALAEGHTALTLWVLLFSFFWNAVPPLFEVVTLSHLRGMMHHYGRVRLWGSLGFIVAVSGGGALLDVFGIGTLAWLMLGMLGVQMVYGWRLWAAPPVVHAASAAGLLAVLRRREVWLLLTVVFLMQMSHGPHYSFFSLYLEQLDYPKTGIGALWSLGVVAEILIFLVMPRLILRFGLYSLLLASLAIAALRWALTAVLADNVIVLILAQCLHAATFGIHHSVCMSLIADYFPGRLLARGQALFVSLGLGAGTALGSYLAGLIWEQFSPALIYWFSAGYAGLALLLAVVGLRPGAQSVSSQS